MSNFKTGKELIQEWKIKDFELFEHVKAGLQPHDQLGRPLSPPDISPKLYTLRTVKKSLDDLLRSNPPGRLTREKLQELFEEHPSKAFGEVYYTEKAQKEFTRLSGEKERIEKELSGIDIHSWANYELPEDLQEARAIINSLLQACFHIEDINKILVPVRPQERAVTDTQNQMLDY